METTFSLQAKFKASGKNAYFIQNLNMVEPTVCGFWALCRHLLDGMCQVPFPVASTVSTILLSS